MITKILIPFIFILLLLNAFLIYQGIETQTELIHKFDQSNCSAFINNYRDFWQSLTTNLTGINTTTPVFSDG